MMFNEPLEAWEIWGYPVLILGTMMVLSSPLRFYLDQVLRLDVLASLLLGAWEVWRSARRRPGLVRAVLVGVSASVSFTAFNPGDHRVIYLITLGLMLYLWLLTEGVPTLYGLIVERLRRRK
jgi:hypothetical protein